LLTGDRIGPTSGSHNLASNERIEEGPSEFVYEPKHDRVSGEYENELTELIEHERVIRERGKVKERIRPSRWS
jgi:hypothetical protein